MKKITSFVTRFIFAATMLGLFSPSLDSIDSRSQKSITLAGYLPFELALFNQAYARRGGGMRGGGMRGGGMRGGMRSSMGSRSFSRPSSPQSSRYYGGNFQSYNRSSMTRPAKRPSSRPSIQPVQKPGNGGKLPNRPGKPGKPHKPHKPGKPDGPTTPVIKPPADKPGRPGVRPPGHRPGKPGVKPPGNRPGKPGVRPPGHRPIHGRPPHHGHRPHFHYPYHGWGGYWPWFWGSAITVGAFVSAIPDDGCDDIMIDGIYYKECNGVLFEPVYEGDDISYKVVEINR